MLNHIIFGIMSGLAALYSMVALPTITVLQVCGLVDVASVKVPNLAGKVAIVTGANTGVGKATAKQLAASGATVILACRSLERGQAAAVDILSSIASKDPTCSTQASGTDSTAPNVVAMELDLSDLRSVRTFAASFSKTYGKLDILVNNAGMNGFVAGMPKRTKQGVEIMFGTNFVGHFLLTTLLLDYLKVSPDGRIVNLSSVMHHFANMNITRAITGEDESRGYEDSKLAMLLFTLELRRRLTGTRVLATAVNPGFVASDIWRGFHALPTVGRIWGCICYLLALTVDQAATVSVAAATAPRPHLPPLPSRASPALDDSIASPARPPAKEEEDWPVYLQPYYLLMGCTLPFEMFGPFAGPRRGLPSLPPDEPRLSALLWRQSEVICARA